MSDCPTLQLGDQSRDGWVEYLQSLLGLPEPKWTGMFDDETRQSVIWFQESHGLRVDGVVGNQTWAVLRGEAVVPASGTDGRDAHSYTQSGLAMRFTNEITYIDGDDVLWVRAMAVGTEDPGEGAVHLTAEVRRPDGTSHQVAGPNEPYGGDSRLHTFHLAGAVGDGPGGVYKALLWLPSETGQDNETFEWNHVPR
jgi:hypothetical protein